MIILGIDPGLARVGYSLIKINQKKLGLDKYQVIDYSCLITSAGQPNHLRLKKIYQGLKKIIDKHQPNFGVIEELFFAKNVKTALKVSEARGVIILALTEKKIPFLSLTPLQIKMSLTGYGRASKKQLQKVIKCLFRLKKTPPDDAADALALALSGAKMVKKICL